LWIKDFLPVNSRKRGKATILASNPFALKGFTVTSGSRATGLV
jgi:hypothetical protein